MPKQIKGHVVVVLAKVNQKNFENAVYTEESLKKLAGKHVDCLTYEEDGKCLVYRGPISGYQREIWKK